MELPELWTSGAIVKRTGYSRETIVGAARRGELVAIAKLPGALGAWLFTWEAVEAWMQAPGRRRPYRRFSGV